MQRKAQARQKNNGSRSATQSSTSRRPRAARAQRPAPRAEETSDPTDSETSQAWLDAYWRRYRNDLLDCLDRASELGEDLAAIVAWVQEIDAPISPRDLERILRRRRTFGEVEKLPSGRWAAIRDPFYERIGARVGGPEREELIARVAFAIALQEARTTGWFDWPACVHTALCRVRIALDS